MKIVSKDYHVIVPSSWLSQYNTLLLLFLWLSGDYILTHDVREIASSSFSGASSKFSVAPMSKFDLCLNVAHMQDSIL